MRLSRGQIKLDNTGIKRRFLTIKTISLLRSTENNVVESLFVLEKETKVF